MKDDIFPSRNCFYPGPRVTRYGEYLVLTHDVYSVPSLTSYQGLAMTH